MTTLEDLLQIIGALYIENRMLQRQLEEALNHNAQQQYSENAPPVEQEEKDVQT